MQNYRSVSTFKNRIIHHDPVLSAADICREFSINRSTLSKRMKKDFNLELQITRRKSKYYNAEDFRAWVKESGLIDP